MMTVLWGAQFSDATAGSPGAIDPPPPSAAVWALPSATDRMLERDVTALDRVDVVGVSLDADGRGIDAVPKSSRRIRRTAHELGLSAVLLMNNYSNRTESFDARAGHRLLARPARIRRVAAAIADVVDRQHWDGVNVDIERVRRGDADGLVRFVQALQEAMPAQKTVSIDVSAARSLDGYRDRGYRMAALGEAADLVILMAYDFSGPSWSEPGPIGPLEWQRDAITAALEVIPAERIELGIAGYGYTWPAPRTGRTGRSISPRTARRKVADDGATAHWRAAAGEWTARLSNGTVLWWSDRRSYDVRRELAVEFGLSGTALWRLGSADRLD